MEDCLNVFSWKLNFVGTGSLIQDLCLLL